MNDFEDILNAYIEGVATRADAQALLRRLHLTPEQRAQVELTLRLADAISDATQATPTAGAETRLRDRLRAHMDSPQEQHDPSIATRLLAPTGQVKHIPPLPDVKAASDEPPPDDQ